MPPTREIWRDARSSDEEAVVAMCLALNQEDPGPRPVNAGGIRRTLETFRRDPQRGRAVVLDDGRRCIGYALLIAFWSNERGGEICIVDELFVEREYRSRGHATELVRGLASGSLWSPPPLSIDLMVTPRNLAARRLYERLGFVETGAAMALMLGDRRQA